MATRSSRRRSRTRCATQQIVEEILNDTMLVVWRKASTYNLRSRVSTWIFGIALRRALKALKRVDDPMEFVPEDSPDHSVAAGQERDVAVLRAAVGVGLRQRLRVTEGRPRRVAQVEATVTGIGQDDFGGDRRLADLFPIRSRE